jgi:hypothetical protein
MAKSRKAKPSAPTRTSQRKAPPAKAVRPRPPKQEAGQFNVLLMLVKVDAPTVTLGEHSFQAMPRAGEYIVKDDAEGRAQVYRVVEIHHPAQPMPAAADVFVCHVGTQEYHLDGLRDRLRGTFR